MYVFMAKKIKILCGYPCLSGAMVKGMNTCHFCSVSIMDASNGAPFPCNCCCFFHLMSSSSTTCFWRSSKRAKVVLCLSARSCEKVYRNVMIYI